MRNSFRLYWVCLVHQQRFRERHGLFLALNGTVQDVTGDLVPAGTTLPVTGYIKGQLIGLYIHVGKDKNIFGSGVIGYDSDQKANVLGGTFAGPSDTSTGVWRGLLINRNSLGGCNKGIPVEGTQLCYVVV